MFKILSSLIVVLILVAACAPPVSEPLPTEPVVPTEPEPAEPKPEPQKDTLVRDLAPIDDVQVMLLESFPVQVNVAIRGYLPDACTEIEHVKQDASGNTFKITIGTVRPKELACADVIEPFEEVVSLDVLGLKAGVYTVDVNGVTQTFELQMDNEPPREDDASDTSTSPGADPGKADEANMQIGIAPVEKVQAVVVSTDPLRVEATVVGYLPDGCTELGDMTQEWEGDTLYVTLTTKRPAGMACITMITPFEQVIPIDVSGITAGTYTIQVNDISTTVTVQ
jgi:inhibitor of cysteine peptidase